MSYHEHTESFLLSVRAYVAAGWTQKAFARTADGERTGLATSTAASRDLIGAIHQTMNDLDRATYAMCPEARDATHLLVRLTGIHEDFRLRHGSPLIAWNDEPGRTREDVLALLDAALDEVRSPTLGPVPDGFSFVGDPALGIRRD